jgi:hypothetical protein
MNPLGAVCKEARPRDKSLGCFQMTVDGVKKEIWNRGFSKGYV